MPRGYGIGYGSIGPNPWASANAAQYLGPGAQFQTLAGAPGSAGGYWTQKGSSTLASRRAATARTDTRGGYKTMGAAPPPPPRPTQRQIAAHIKPLKPAPKGGFFSRLFSNTGYKTPPRLYKQPSNPVVPAGDSAPYKGSEAPIAAPSKGGTLRIGGMNVWSGPNKPTTPVTRITVPQDATQTRQQVKGGRKQIKLPEPEALAAIGGAGLLLVLL